MIIKEDKNEKPSMIIERKEPEPHYELHYANRIDFVKLDGTVIGTTVPKPVYFNEDGTVDTKKTFGQFKGEQ